MSTAPEQTSPSQQAAPDAAPTTAPAAPPRVRDLTRWHIPFHYLPAAAVIVISVLLLVSGGTAGVFGGWLLAAALPIAIGAFLRSAWFALLPAVVWIGWLVATSDIPVNSSLSNTPTTLGLALAAIGCGATLVAQRAIFPATEPGAWEASMGRLLPELGEDAPAPAAPDHTDDHTIEPTIAEPISATEEELAAAAAANLAQAATEVQAGDGNGETGSPAARRSDGQVEPAKAGVKVVPVVPEPRVEIATPAAAAETDEAADDVNDVDVDTDADARASDAAEPVPAASARPDAADGADDTDAADAANETVATAEDPADEDDVDPLRPTAAPPTELPIDADPAPLDEGGHVTEFAAISLEDAIADVSATADDAESAADDDADADDDAFDDRNAAASGSADQRA